MSFISGVDESVVITVTVAQRCLQSVGDDIELLASMERLNHISGAVELSIYIERWSERRHPGHVVRHDVTGIILI